MIVNVVDTKGDFKKKIETDFKPETVSGYIDGLKSIEREIGKRIIVILRNLRWRIEEVEDRSNDSLKNELESLLIDGNILNIEITDLWF